MGFALHCVFINKSNNAFLEHSLSHDFRAHGKKFVKNRKDLLIQVVRNVVREVVQHVQEEKLEVRVALAVVALLYISKHYLQELQHREGR